MKKIVACVSVLLLALVAYLQLKDSLYLNLLLGGKEEARIRHLRTHMHPRVYEQEVAVSGPESCLEVYTDVYCNEKFGLPTAAPAAAAAVSTHLSLHTANARVCVIVRHHRCAPVRINPPTVLICVQTHNCNIRTHMRSNPCLDTWPRHGPGTIPNRAPAARGLEQPCIAPVSSKCNHDARCDGVCLRRHSTRSRHLS